MRMIVCIVSVVITLGAAVFGLFFLLLGLNGYSEKQATPSLAVYVVLSLVTVLGVGIGSPFATKRLAQRRSLGNFGASAIVVTGSSIIGVVLLIALLFTSFVLADILRGQK